MRPLLILTVAAALGAAEFRLPPTWEGAKEGTTDGNPLLVDGKPRWRLDQVYPDDFEDADDYRPLAFVPHEGAKRWFNRDHAQGGQPVAWIDGGAPAFGVKGRAEGPLDYRKAAALGFIAPAAGVYRFRAKADVQRWEGGGEAVVYVYDRFTNQDGDREMVPRAAIRLKPENGQPVEGPALKLAAGSEYVLIAALEGFHTGANIALRDFVVESP